MALPGSTWRGIALRRLEPHAARSVPGWAAFLIAITVPSPQISLSSQVVYLENIWMAGEKPSVNLF
jgi:hypothetical protein